MNRSNKIIMNYAKTEEIVLHRLQLSRFSVPVSLCSTELVHNAKLLGITLSENAIF
jgi:hypothetical protein